MNFPVALTVLAAISSIFAATTPDVRMIKPGFPSWERPDYASLTFHLILAFRQESVLAGFGR